MKLTGGKKCEILSFFLGWLDEAKVSCIASVGHPTEIGL